MIGIDLIAACAPSVAPETIRHVVAVESRGDPLSIGVNGGRMPRLPRDAADAAALARAAIRQGYSVDLGLMQVNSRNLAALGLTVEQMFEPCANLGAGARLLTDFYLGARKRFPDDQAALRASLSAYNTGSFSRGFANGYVARYRSGAAPLVPALIETAALAAPAHDAQRPPLRARATPYTISSTVFVRKESKSMPAVRDIVRPIISRSPDDGNVPGVQVEFDAESAEAAGAFEDDAMSYEDAWESNIDILNTTVVGGGRHPSREKE